LKTKKLTYWLFYSAALLVFLVSVFAYDLIIYVKPLVILSLTLLYILNAKKVNHLVVLSLPLILVCEIIFLKGYLENFVILHILLSAYYALNIAVLWKSLRRIKIKFRKVFTLQLAISMILITYVLFSVAQLILPQVSDHILVLIMLIIFFALFIGVCYYIYLNSFKSAI